MTDANGTPTPVQRPHRGKSWEITFFITVILVYLLASYAGSGSSRIADTKSATGRRSLQHAGIRMSIRIALVIDEVGEKVGIDRTSNARESLSDITGEVQKTLRSDPGDLQSRFALAVLQRRLNQSATRTLAPIPKTAPYPQLRSLVIDPKPDPALLNDRAIRSFIDRNPARYLWRASIYQRLGNPTQAQAEIRAGVREAQRPVIAYFIVVAVAAIFGFAGFVSLLILLFSRKHGMTTPVPAPPPIPTPEPETPQPVSQADLDFPTGPPPPPPSDPNRIGLALGAEALLAFVLGMLFISVAFSAVAALVMEVLIASGMPKATAETTISSILTPLVILANPIAAFLTVVWIQFRRGRRVPVGWVMQPLARHVLYGLAILFVGGLLTLAAMLLLSRMGLRSQEEIVTIIASVRSLPLRILVIITASILVPIAEETIFRGFLMRGIRTYWGPIAAIILSSLVFAFGHGDPVAAVGIFFLSLVLAWGAHHTRSLLPSTIAHGIFNGIQIVLLFVLLS